MTDESRDAIDLTAREVGGQTVFMYQSKRGNPKHVNSLVRKLKMAALVVAGVALGTLAFLFLVSLISFLLPVLAIFVLLSVLGTWLRPRTS